METVPDLGRKYLDGNGAHAVYFNGEDCMHYLKKNYKRVCPGFEKHGCLLVPKLMSGTCQTQSMDKCGAIWKKATMFC